MYWTVPMIWDKKSNGARPCPDSAVGRGGADESAAGENPRHLWADYATPPEFFRNLKNNCGFFSEMSKEEMEALLFASARWFFTPGETLFHKGERGKDFYIILWGEVVLRNGKKEKARLGPGEVVGELSSLMQVPRTKTALTSKFSMLLAIHRDAVVSETPLLSKKISRKLRKQIFTKLRRTAADHRPYPRRALVQTLS